MRAARTRRLDRAERSPAPVETLSLPVLGARWQSALDAAQAALAAAASTLPPEELRGRRSRLDAERVAAAGLLEGLARDHNLPARFVYLTTPAFDLRRLLGLPDGIEACVFTLDGVLVKRLDLGPEHRLYQVEPIERDNALTFAEAWNHSGFEKIPARWYSD